MKCILILVLVFLRRVNFSTRGGGRQKYQIMSADPIDTDTLVETINARYTTTIAAITAQRIRMCLHQDTADADLDSFQRFVIRKHIGSIETANSYCQDQRTKLAAIVTKGATNATYAKIAGVFNRAVTRLAASVKTLTEVATVYGAYRAAVKSIKQTVLPEKLPARIRKTYDTLVRNLGDIRGLPAAKKIIERVPSVLALVKEHPAAPTAGTPRKRKRKRKPTPASTPKKSKGSADADVDACVCAPGEIFFDALGACKGCTITAMDAECEKIYQQIDQYRSKFQPADAPTVNQTVKPLMKQLSHASAALSAVGSGVGDAKMRQQAIRDATRELAGAFAALEWESESISESDAVDENMATDESDGDSECDSADRSSVVPDSEEEIDVDDMVLAMDTNADEVEPEPEPESEVAPGSGAEANVFGVLGKEMTDASVFLFRRSEFRAALLLGVNGDTDGATRMLKDVRERVASQDGVYFEADQIRDVRAMFQSFEAN